MGYCVRWNGRFDLNTPLTDEHAKALRHCEDVEEYPGDTPDRRFNPWCVSKDNAGFEVLTDKPGDWKAWLQYTIDHWLKPWGYSLSGSVTWAGERGDAGVITIEDGKVRARRPSPTKAWADVRAEDRTHIGELMAEAMGDDRSVYSASWLAALHALGCAPTSDRTEFDD